MTYTFIAGRPTLVDGLNDKAFAFIDPVNRTICCMSTFYSLLTRMWYSFIYLFNTFGAPSTYKIRVKATIKSSRTPRQSQHITRNSSGDEIANVNIKMPLTWHRNVNTQRNIAYSVERIKVKIYIANKCQVCSCQCICKLFERGGIGNGWWQIIPTWNTTMKKVILICYGTILPTPTLRHRSFYCNAVAYVNMKQDAQLSQRDPAAGCVIVFAKSRRLELGDNILRTV